MPTSRTLSMSVAVSIRWRLTPDSKTVLVNQPLSVALLRTKVALPGQLAARSCLASELMLKVLSRCAGARYADRRSTHCTRRHQRWLAVGRSAETLLLADTAVVSCGA